MIGHGGGERKREGRVQGGIRCSTGTTEPTIVLLIEIRGAGRVLGKKRMSSIWGMLL